MKTPQVVDSLRRLFREELDRPGAKRGIVFWYDSKGDFESEIASLDLDGVSVLRLDQLSAFELKIRLETEDTASSFLLYSPSIEPTPEQDWLLDIRLYSRTFVADKASVVLDDLGLSNTSLKEHLEKRESFFRSQDRLTRLKKWVAAEDQAQDLDLKMLAVITRADLPDAFNVLMKLLDERHSAVDNNPKSFSELQKHELEPFFWELMRQSFGYEDQHPSLTDLSNRLLVTDFALNLKGELPSSLQHFLLPSKKLATSATAFISQWRRNIAYHQSYNALAQQVEKEMNIADQLNGLDEVALAEVQTFEAVERQVIRCLRDQLMDGSNVRLANLQNVISHRRTGHWTRKSEADEAGALYSSIYDAIEAAAEMLALRQKYSTGLSFPDAASMYASYSTELYRFDQLYRKFHEAADQVELDGGDLLKGLQQAVESCYSNWFTLELASNWGKCLDGQNGLLNKWKISGVPNQQDFFRTNVDTKLSKSPDSKVYVIVSDAFRFEAAEELTRELNSKNRFDAKLSSLLGVVPSYTALGMAALLPHKVLDYRAGSGTEVVADGILTNSLEGRKRILERIQGTVIKAEDLMALNREQGREFVKPWRVIYIYHNKVDATGDAAASESRTFKAVRETIDDIAKYVARIINELNGSQVLITADHGFLFQDKFPEAPERSGLDIRPAGTLKAKKRYLFGKNLGHAGNVWHGAIKTTAGIEGDMEFWIPKGINRFHFVGGARFVHGGAMLQEVVVPVITVKSLRGNAAEAAAVRQVEISMLGSVRRIVNNVQRFEFIQTEAVSERLKPRTLVVSIRDKDLPISNEVTVTFDSDSPAMDERKKSVQLFLKAGQYDKRRDYFLVLRDAVSKIEYLRIPVTIDLTFASDF